MLRMSRVNDFPDSFKILSQNVFHHRRRHKFRLFQCLSVQEMAELRILRRSASFYGIVSAVVRPRGHFIENEIIALYEELDREDSPVVAAFHEFLAGADDFRLQLRSCRDNAEVQDAALVDIAA